MKGKDLCKAERPSLDIISTLPQAIIETILCLLLTKEAARTSILSREWRYKWTKISKLEFHVPLLSERKTKEKQLQGVQPFGVLHQILLLHQGPIHEFNLSTDQATTDEDSFGFDQILLHLSKNHAVKKLNLHAMDDFSWHNLPISIFSFHHLKDLDIICFHLDHQPVFNGFNNLKSLSLIDVGISTKTLLHLLSNCPSLKRLTMFIGESHLGGKDCTVIELFKCLPMIEHLSFGYVCEWVVVDSVPRDLPTFLIHLKYFSFEEMWFDDGHGVSLLLVLIKCSPNLEKIKLAIKWDHTCYKECSVVWEDYSDVRLEHLNELKFEGFSNAKHEMEFVKFILARSPKLKKVSIFGQNQESNVLKTLLEAPRIAGNSNCQMRFASNAVRALKFC